MPSKDARVLGEDLVVVTARIPPSALTFIDQHVARLRRQHRGRKFGRSEAIRDLIMRAIDALEAPLLPPQSALALAALAAAGEPDLPPVPAPAPTAPYEARALTPDLEDMPLEPEPLLTREPTDVTQESAVPDAQTEDLRPRGGRPARPKRAVAPRSQAKPK